MAQTPENDLPAPSRLARISSLVMICSFAAGLLLLFCAMLSGDTALLVLLFAVFAISLVASMVRLSCSIFRESQMRLSELLLCVLLIAFLTSGLTVLPLDLDEEVRPFAVALFLVMSSLFVFAGAARGWGMARKQGETRANRRLLLLLYSWLQIACLLAVAVAVLIAMAIVISILVRRYH